MCITVIPAHEMAELVKQIETDANHLTDMKYHQRQGEDAIGEREHDVRRLELTVECELALWCDGYYGIKCAASNHKLVTQNELVNELVEVLRKSELAVAESKADKVRAGEIETEIAELDAGESSSGLR